MNQLHDSRQAGATIEISDQMKDAGATVVEESSAYYEARVLASMVYTAMMEAKNQKCDRIAYL